MLGWCDTTPHHTEKPGLDLLHDSVLCVHALRHHHLLFTLCVPDGHPEEKQQSLDSTSELKTFLSIRSNCKTFNDVKHTDMLGLALKTLCCHDLHLKSTV